MPSQVQSGKAFEYALINESYNILSPLCHVHAVKDNSFETCLEAYNSFPAKQQQQYSQAATASIRHIVSLEPRLQYAMQSQDVLTLQLQADNAGQAGDVRDLLFIRAAQNWQIGISAKNNHNALKHSRLSAINDFGKGWVGEPCSQEYFTTVRPIFERLAGLQKEGVLWRNVSAKHAEVYLPVLTAFANELKSLNAAHQNIPQNLLSYLIGRNDFYKVIKRPKVVEVFAFNLYGTLGKSAGSARPVLNVPKLHLPTDIIQFQMKPKSKDTLLLVCDHGWQLSFRIHNAESRVVASLKFDVNLVGNPNAIYSHYILY